jgi:hypothetical protein
VNDLIDNMLLQVAQSFDVAFVSMPFDFGVRSESPEGAAGRVHKNAVVGTAKLSGQRMADVSFGGTERFQPQTRSVFSNLIDPLF